MATPVGLSLTGAASITGPSGTSIQLQDVLGALTGRQGQLLFSRSDITDTSTTTPADDQMGNITLPVSGSRSVDSNGNEIGGATLHIVSIVPPGGTSIDASDITNGTGGAIENYSIAIHASGDYCILVETNQTTGIQRTVF